MNRRSFLFAIAALAANSKRLLARHNRKGKQRRIALAPVETKAGFWVLLPLIAPQAGFEIEPQSKMVTLVKGRYGSLEAVELESGFVVLLPVT